VVICFNFRTDRGREITQALTQRDFPEEGMHKLNLYYLTMTEYDKEFQNVHVIFNDSNLPMTMGEVLEGAGKKTNPHRRNRKISTRYVLLLRWPRGAF